MTGTYHAEVVGSVSIGANLIGEDTQQRKLELVGEAAARSGNGDIRSACPRSSALDGKSHRDYRGPSETREAVQRNDR